MLEKREIVRYLVHAFFAAQEGRDMGADRFDTAGCEDTMMAVVTTGNGGYDKLVYREVPVPTPGPGEVLLRVLAAGARGAQGIDRPRHPRDPDRDPGARRPGGRCTARPRRPGPGAAMIASAPPRRSPEITE